MKKLMAVLMLVLVAGLVLAETDPKAMRMIRQIRLGREVLERPAFKYIRVDEIRQRSSGSNVWFNTDVTFQSNTVMTGKISAEHISSTDDMTVADELSITGAVSMADTLYTAGTVGVGSTVTCGAALTVTGVVELLDTLDITGAATADSTLYVAGTVGIGSTVTCGAALTVTGAVSVADEVTIDGKYAIVGPHASTPYMAISSNVVAPDSLLVTNTFGVSFVGSPIVVATWRENPGAADQIYVSSVASNQVVIGNPAEGTNYSFIAVGQRP